MDTAGTTPPRILLVPVVAPTDAQGALRRCGSLQERLLASDADVAVLDVATLTAPDATTVEALARVLLTARRLGRTVRLRHASPRLLELLDFFGLDDLLPPEMGPDACDS